MRTEAIVESFEASLREAFQQLQGGANAIPWWERKSLAQGMTESFVVGTASETAFLLVALLAKDPKWEVRAAIADLLPVLPEAESKRLTDQLMADSNTYVRRSVERAIERRKREIRAAGKARKSADQVSAQLQAIEDEFGKTAATKSLRMAERYSEMLVASIVHDLRSIMTHLKVNCYSLIEEVIADAGSQAKRYGVRVRNDLQLLESSVEDMVTFTRPVPTERLPERLAVLVAEALELTRDNVRKAKFDPELVSVQHDVPESIVVPTEFSSSGSPVLHLSPSRSSSPESQARSRRFLQDLNTMHRDQHPGESELEARIENFELAARMQLTATQLLDLSQETEATRKLYGLDNPTTAAYGTRCLMARRLVESGVRFVQVFPPLDPSFQPWDNHSNLKNDLRKICGYVDQPSAALITDLKQRGLLDDVIVMWTGEFGRLPITEGADGRDHNRHAFSTLMSGGGFKAGHIHGATDEFGYKSVENRVSVPDLHATILNQLGIDHTRLTFTHSGRPERLTDPDVTGARVVEELLT